MILNYRLFKKYSILVKQKPKDRIHDYRHKSEPSGTQREYEPIIYKEKTNKGTKASSIPSVKEFVSSA